ncbi:MAG TPA: insulinase family protein [Planctomycetes bacterium]|nr:insulinase family protein [Planctomycetota bacterium]
MRPSLRIGGWVHLWLAVLAVGLPRTADQPAAGAEQPIPTVASRIEMADTVTLATLSNGLTVIVQENHVAPVATVRCFVKNTGSAFEGRHLGSGLSHLLEHVVSGGSTRRRTEKQIEEIIDTFGGATNAYTASGVTAYYINCPARNVMSAIELLADAMQHAALQPEEVERELKVVRRELADGEVDRRRVRWKLLHWTLYTRHPLRHPTIGYLDRLERITRDVMIEFYRSRYVPNNQVFVVVGDVRTDAVLEEVARQWAGTPRGPETVVAMPAEPRQLAPRQAFHQMDGATCDLVVAWPTVPLSHPELYPLDLAAYILAEGESARLQRVLKYERKLALSVGAASYTPHFAKGLFAVTASTMPERWEEACREILRQVYRLRDELVDPTELAKAKKQKAAELVFGQQTVEQAAERLGRNFLATGDPLFDKIYVDQIQRVTAEQIRASARRYFVPQRLNRVVILPPGRAPRGPKQRERTAEGQVRSLQLPNGLRVLVKRHAHLPMVNMQAYVLGGCLADSPQTAGRSTLVAKMLDKGTASRSAQQIATYFDSIGARLAINSGRNTIYGSLTVLKEDFPQAAALLAECFIAPTFPQEEFDKVKALALGAIARRRDDPHQEVIELFYDALPADCPYHVIPGGSESSIRGLTAEDVKAYHTRYFVPNNMLVTVFGDIEPEQAVEVIKEQFGSLKAHPDFEPVPLDHTHVLAENVTRHKKTGKPTAMVLLAYAAPGIRQRKDFAALIVLDAVTSGYTYPGGWLHNELRGQGLVYFVHAMPITGPVPGYFAVLCQTRPEAVDEVVGRIQRNLERVKQGAVTADELQRAKQMVIAFHAQENTTIAAQAQQAALDELYGLGYDYDETFDARIEAVRLEDVTRVARRYFTRYVLVTTSPADR